jgi:hypothetical protein
LRRAAVHWNEAKEYRYVGEQQKMKAFVYGGPGPKALEDRPKPKATIATETLDNINDIFARMHHGDIQGRIVIDFQGKLHGHATA